MVQEEVLWILINIGIDVQCRFEIYYEDALAFLKNYTGPKFDVVPPRLSRVDWSFFFVY